MEIEKKSVEMDSGEVTEKKPQQRRGGIRTLPFILGETTLYYCFVFLPFTNTLFNESYLSLKMVEWL